MTTQTSPNRYGRLGLSTVRDAATGFSDRAKAATFYVIAVALATLYAATPNPDTFVYMFTPLVAALVMLFVVTRDGYTTAGRRRLGLHRLGLRAWPAAILVPLAVLASAYGLVWASGLAMLSVPQQPFGFPRWALPVVLLVTVAIATLTNSLGEELGWRGYLLPHLETLGVWRAALLSGFLHGVWHLPYMLLATGYHSDGNQFVVLPLFLVSVTVAGVFFGYLRLTTDSVWPAAIGHSMHNALWAIFGAFTVASSPLAGEYLAGDSGVLISIGYAALAGTLLYRYVAAARSAE
jgi:membrane protease YdiL (CAAX protease family)